MSAGIVFQLLAALAYALLGVGWWRLLARGNSEIRIGRLTHGVLVIALLLQAVGLQQAMLSHEDGLHLGWAPSGWGC